MFKVTTDGDLEQLIAVTESGARAHDPTEQELARDHVNLADGRAATIVTIGPGTTPVGMVLFVLDGQTAYLVAGHLPAADFDRDGPALRAALLSLTIDPVSLASPAILRNVAVGIGTAAGLLVMSFAVLAMIWGATTRGLHSGIPGWVWITSCLISMSVVGQQREITGEYAVAAGFLGLVFVVTSIAVGVRWLRRRERGSRFPDDDVRS